MTAPKLLLACLLTCTAPILARAEEAASSSGQSLAARLSALQQDGASDVRLRLEVKRTGGSGEVELQLKARRTRAVTDLVYLVLAPKERRGEAVLLKKAVHAPPSGALFMPPDHLRQLDAAQLKDAFFGSALSYEDVVENFFAWSSQVLTGTETVDGVSCQILESKPGKGDHSAYASVRTWVDLRRGLPLRVEKYSASGELARRIDTAKVNRDDAGRYIPSRLVVHHTGQDSVTELEGTRIRHGVTFTEREFTPEGLQESGSK